MKINKYLSVLALASLLFGATSCSDYIDIDPENSVPEEKVDYTNLDNMYMPVSGVYAKVRTGAMHWVIWPLSTVRDGDIWSGKPDDQAQLIFLSHTLPSNIQTRQAYNSLFRLWISCSFHHPPK